MSPTDQPQPDTTRLTALAKAELEKIVRRYEGEPHYGMVIAEAAYRLGLREALGSSADPPPSDKQSETPRQEPDLVQRLLESAEHAGYDGCSPFLVEEAALRIAELEQDAEDARSALHESIISAGKLIEVAQDWKTRSDTAEARVAALEVAIRSDLKANLRKT